MKITGCNVRLVQLLEGSRLYIGHEIWPMADRYITFFPCHQMGSNGGLTILFLLGRCASLFPARS